MNKKIIIGALITLVVIIGLFFLGKASQSDDSQQSGASQKNEVGNELVLGEENFSFGTVSMANGEVKKTIEIRNISSQPVEIESLYTSCMCTAASINMNGKNWGPFGMIGHGYVPKLKETLGAGQTAMLDIMFDPAAHGPAGVGKISRNVMMETTGGKSYQIDFDATVTP